MHVLPHGPLQAARSPGLRGETLEEVEQPEDLAPPALRRELTLHAGRIRHRADTVEVHQPNVADRGGNAGGVVQFARRAPPHRAARIDEEVDVDILLLAEQFDEQAVQPGVDAPIDVPVVVPDLIAAIVGEFHPSPQGAAAALPAQAGAGEAAGLQA